MPFANLNTIIAGITKPSIGTQIATSYNTASVQFGSGYRQLGKASNINNKQQEVTLVWNSVTLAEFEDIEGFFDVNFANPFYYTLDGKTTASLWTLENFSYSTLKGNRFAVNVGIKNWYGVE